MSQTALNQIIEQLQTLEPSELEQLGQIIQQHLQEVEILVRQATFHQALLDSGLVRQIKRPTPEEKTRQRLISVEGAPVSQTMLEERR